MKSFEMINITLHQHHRIRLTIKTTIYNASSEHGDIININNKYITSERCSSFIIAFDDVMMMTFDSSTHIPRLPSDPWPLCPRVAWSTCPRPPPPSTRLMSLSAPHIFAYCEMLPQWSLATPTHETGNRCQCNDNNIQEMDSRLSGLCS